MALSEGYVYTTGGTYVVQSPILAVKVTTDWTQFADDTSGQTYKATARIYNGSTLLDSTIDVFITDQETAPDSIKDADRNVQLTTLLGQNRYVLYSLPKNLTIAGEDAVVVSQSNETFSLGLNTNNDFWDDIRTEIVAESGCPITITSQKVTSEVEEVGGVETTVSKNILKYTLHFNTSSITNNYYDGSDFTAYYAFTTDSHLSVETSSVTIGSGDDAVDRTIATISWKGLKTGSTLVANVSTPVYSDEIEQGYGLVFEQTNTKTKISVDANIIPETPNILEGNGITVTKNGNDNTIDWDGFAIVDKNGNVIEGSTVLTGDDTIFIDSDGETATATWRGILHGGAYATEIEAGTGISLTTANGKTTIAFTGASANGLLTSITLTGDDYITPTQESSSSYDLEFEGLKHGTERFLEVAAASSSGITLSTTNNVLTIGFDQTLAGLTDVAGSTYIESTYSSTNNEFVVSWKGFDVDSTSGNTDGSAFKVAAASGSNLTVEKNDSSAVFDWTGFNIPNSELAKGLSVATDSAISLTKSGTNAVLDWNGFDVYIDGDTAGTYSKWSSGVKGIKAGQGVSFQVTDGVATLNFAPAEVSSVYGASVSAADSYVTVTPSDQSGYKDYAVKWNGFLTNSTDDSATYMQKIFAGSNLSITNDTSTLVATVGWKGFQTNSTTEANSYVRKLHVDSDLTIVNDTTNDKATISWTPVLGDAITEPVLREKVMVGLDDGEDGYEQTTEIVTGINASTSDANFLNLTSTVASQAATVLASSANTGSAVGVKLTSDNASIAKVNAVASSTDGDAVTAITSDGTVSALSTSGTVTDKEGYIPGGRAQAITAESALVSTTETFQTSASYLSSSSETVFSSFTAPTNVNAITSSSMLEQTNVPSSVSATTSTGGAIASITGATAKVPKLATATLTTTNAITALTDVNIIPHVVSSVSSVPSSAIVLDTITDGDSTTEIKSIQFVSSIACVNNQLQCTYGYLYFTKATTTATFKGIDTSISSPSYVTGFTENPTSNDYESFNVDTFTTTTTDVVTSVTVGTDVAVATPSWKKTNDVIDGLTEVSAPIAATDFGTAEVIAKPSSTVDVVTASDAISTGKTFVTGYDSTGPTKEYFGTVSESVVYHVASSSSAISASTVNTGYGTSTSKFLTAVTGSANLLQTTSEVSTESLAKALDTTKTESVLKTDSITKATALTADGSLVKKAIVYDKVPIDSKLSNAAKAPSGTTTTNATGGTASGTTVQGTATTLFPNT